MSVWKQRWTYSYSQVECFVRTRTKARCSQIEVLCTTDLMGYKLDRRAKKKVYYRLSYCWCIEQPSLILKLGLVRFFWFSFGIFWSEFPGTWKFWPCSRQIGSSVSLGAPETRPSNWPCWPPSVGGCVQSQCCVRLCLLEAITVCFTTRWINILVDWQWTMCDC